MKMKLALYSLYGKNVYAKECSDWIEGDNDYTRLTEPQDITFIERDHAEVVLEQVDVLKKRREEVRAEMGAKIAEIENDIQKLMAIEHSTTDEG